MPRAVGYIDPAYEDDPDAVRIGGIDIGGGGDRTVIVERIGSSVGRIESFSDRDPMLRLASWLT